MLIHIANRARGLRWEEEGGGMLHHRHQLSNGPISILQFLHVQNQQLKNILLYNGMILNSFENETQYNNGTRCYPFLFLLLSGALRSIIAWVLLLLSTNNKNIIRRSTSTACCFTPRLPVAISIHTG